MFETRPLPDRWRGPGATLARALVLAGLTGAAACYSPHPVAGLPCSADGACPDGQRCDPDRVCRVPGDGDGDGDEVDGGCEGGGVAQRVVASGLQDDDLFGTALASSGAWLAIGVEGDDELGDAAGAVYLFERTDLAWSERQKLTASDGGAGDRFGVGVAIDGDVLVIGAPGVGATGATYVFERDGESWTQRGTLFDPEEAASAMGAAVAVSGDLLAAGAPIGGYVYLYRREGGSWEPDGSFVAADGATSFGAALAMNDGWVAIGTPEDDELGPLSGSISLIMRDGDGWVPGPQILPSDGEADDLFGSAAAFTSDVLVVGAPGGAGTVYVYRGADLDQETILSAADAGSDANLGRAVAIQGDLIAAGASADQARGAAYLYRADGGTGWAEAAKLTDPDGADFDLFGRGVALGDDTVVIGAPQHDAGGADVGAVVAYDLACAGR